MNKIGAFIKKCRITFCIPSGLVLLHAYVTENKLADPYLFPSTDAIKQAFISGHDMMVGNILASFKLLISSMTVSLFIALFLGAIMGASIKVREALYLVIYASSIISSVLLPPFVFLMVSSLFSVSIFLVVYSIIWVIPSTTITGIMTIDKRYLDETAALELRRFKRLMKVILPAISPSILVGSVNSLRSSFVMLVFAEVYGVGQGMGYFVKKYAESDIFVNTWVDFVFMVIILVIVM